jgi:hypothetical protein
MLIDNTQILLSRCHNTGFGHGTTIYPPAIWNRESSVMPRSSGKLKLSQERPSAARLVATQDTGPPEAVISA